MVNDKKQEGYDTLFLVINEKNGVVSEYQRQLYEASLLGIDRVMYCFIESKDKNSNGRLGNIQKKLNDTCEVLKMQSLNPVVSLLGPCYNEVIKTNEEGYAISAIYDYDISFESYKKERGTLQNRERIGKVLTKS